MNKHKRNTVLIIGSVIVLMVISLCILFAVVIHDISRKNQIDYSSYAIEELAYMPDDVYYLVASHSASGSASGVVGEKSSLDYATYTSKFEEMQGIETVQVTKVTKGRAYTFQCAVSCEEGDIKVFLVSPSDNIIKIFENNTMDEIMLNDYDEGLYRIRVVSQHAKKGEVKISRKIANE